MMTEAAMHTRKQNCVVVITGTFKMVNAVMVGV